MGKPLLSVLAFGIVLGAIASASAADEVRYTRESTPLFDGAKGKILGQLPPGTPVTLKTRSGAMVEVVVHGWTEDHRELELFADKAPRLSRAQLVRVDKGRLEPLKTEVGRYDVAWTKVRLTGWVAAARLVPDLNAVWNAARALHRQRCTACHDFMPASELSAQQWSGTLRIMSHRAALTPEEAVLLKQYLQSGARAQGDP